jgi:hypothetical protein
MNDDQSPDPSIVWEEILAIFLTVAIVWGFFIIYFGLWPWLIAGALPALPAGLLVFVLTRLYIP